ECEGEAPADRDLIAFDHRTAKPFGFDRLGPRHHRSFLLHQRFPAPLARRRLILLYPRIVVIPVPQGAEVITRDDMGDESFNGSSGRHIATPAIARGRAIRPSPSVKSSSARQPTRG